MRGDIRAGFVMTKPDDFHVHVRQGEMLRRVIPYTARDFGRALMMPNVDPPVWTASGVRKYREEILAAAPHGFEPLMTIYLTDHTSPEMILEAGKAGAIAAKYYPRHGTTGSGHGITPENFLKQRDWFAALQEAGMVLCIHAEQPTRPYLERETAFLKLFVDSELPARFPKLRMVIEHMSTWFAVDVVSRYDNVGGTITVHHLLLTADDVFGNSHHFCNPVAKDWKCRQALVEAAVMGKNPRVFFGSDSAPHPLSKKSQPFPPAGVFTAPMALPMLAQIFQNENRLGNLANFASKFGADFYRLPEQQDKIELVMEPFTVPDPTTVREMTRRNPDAEVDEDAQTDPPPPDVDPIIPFYSGQPIHWSVRYDR